MLKTAQLAHLKAGPDDGLAEGQFTAYASVFGNKDSYGDVVQPGAFADTLAEWSKGGAALPLLYGHNMTDPDFNIGHVVAAEEDERGLKITSQIDLEGPKGAQVYRLLKGKRVSQMSFAYDIVEGGPAKSEDLGDYYSLDKLKLYEVSVVPIGANTETEILAVKHLTDAVRAGRALPAKSLELLVAARDAINSVLSSDTDGKDQNEASESEPVTEEAPDGTPLDEPTRDPSAFLAIASLL